jgi:hypothetical protein
MIDYFTQSQPGLGSISWTMGLVWVLGLAFGVYFLTQWHDSNPIHYRFGRQVGIITAILSALGIGQLAARFAQIPVLEWRLWSYLLAFASLGFWGWALYFALKRLPALVAASRSSRGARGTARDGVRTHPANGLTATPRPERQPRPMATTTRREARRERKRRHR